MESEQQLSLSLIKEDDITEVCGLMKAANATFAKIQSPEIYAAICSDALQRDDVVLVVAKIDNTVAGYSLNVIDRRRYWRAYFFRYPVLAAKIANNLLLKQIKLFQRVKHQSTSLDHSLEKFLNIVPTKRSWKDSSPTIAKLLHICVSENARGRSIGLKLLFYAFKILKDRGVSRVDTMIRIDNNNISSIKMNRKAGWKFSKTGDYLFGTIDLNKTSEFDK
jgi:ribosomal protein S18 acetylase RimI-like enzyme